MEKVISVISELEEACCNNILFFIFDRKYKIIYASPLAVQQQLYHKSDKLTGKELFTLVDPLDAKAITTEISFDTSEPQKIDYLQLLCADGTVAGYSGYFQKFQDENSKEDLMLAVLKNKLQNTQQDSKLNEIITNIIIHSEEAIVILQANAKVRYANNTFLRWYGLTQSELQVIPFYEIDNEINNLQKWEILKAELQEHLSRNFETKFVTAAGSTIDLERRWRIYREGAVELYVCFMLPIKERKETEKKIHKTLERQHILSQIAFILNAHENFEYKVNEALRILGNYLQVHRVLIFQNILSNKATSCIFEWHADEFLPRRFDLQAIPYSLLPEISRQLDHEPYAVYESISQVPQELIPYFRPYEIHALMAISFRFDEKHPFGFLSIIDHKQKHNWKESDKRFILTFCEILMSTFRQKQNFDLLVKSEKRFRELAELLPEMVCEAAINGKMTFANKYAQVQFGFTENDLAKGLIFFNFFHPDDRQRVIDHFEKLLSNEHINNKEYLIINREKQVIPVLLYMNIIMQDHLPIGFRAVIVDISERKKHEKHLENLASVIESTPFAILEADSSGNITYLNEKAQELNPLPDDQLPVIKRHIQTVFETQNKVSDTIKIHHQEYRCFFNFNPVTHMVNLYIVG